MSASYVAVQWNPNKKRYDQLLILGITLYLLSFFLISYFGQKPDERLSEMVILIRAFGTSAILLLHIVLAIGPLARMSKRFAPILYNRRHMGVATAFLALVHASLVILFYHGFGVVNPFVSLLTSNSQISTLSTFPFESLGLIALIILILLASISHDFWQRNLGRDTWKSLHMLIYPAYGLVVTHVALGAMQSEKAILPALLLATGVLLVVGLHFSAALIESKRERSHLQQVDSGWIKLGPIESIPLNRARMVVAPAGERIAVFRHDGGVHAVTNLCKHQGGPLSEGKIIDGCITCPWHGWQYKPEDGVSPPPFDERVATYNVRTENGSVFVSTQSSEGIP